MADELPVVSLVSAIPYFTLLRPCRRGGGRNVRAA
jgi:hypothetical protein